MTHLKNTSKNTKKTPKKLIFLPSALLFFSCVGLGSLENGGTQYSSTEIVSICTENDDGNLTPCGWNDQGRLKIICDNGSQVESDECVGDPINYNETCGDLFKNIKSVCESEDCMDYALTKSSQNAAYLFRAYYMELTSNLSSQNYFRTQADCLCHNANSNSLESHSFVIKRDELSYDCVYQDAQYEFGLYKIEFPAEMCALDTFDSEEIFYELDIDNNQSGHSYKTSNSVATDCDGGEIPTWGASPTNDLLATPDSSASIVIKDRDETEDEFATSDLADLTLITLYETHMNWSFLQLITIANGYDYSWYITSLFDQDRHCNSFDSSEMCLNLITCLRDFSCREFDPSTCSSCTNEILDCGPDCPCL